MIRPVKSAAVMDWGHFCPNSVTTYLFTMNSKGVVAVFSPNFSEIILKYEVLKMLQFSGLTAVYTYIRI